MNWAKENKFLTGFIVVMVIGVGALGFKVFSAGSELDEADARYSAKAARYNALRHNNPYPNRENLAKYEEQKGEAAKVINDFQAQLAKKEFPVEPMSPEQFQDVLRRAVTDVRAKAAASNVGLPTEKFYLGFEKYEAAPPDRDAATPLGRDLKAIEWVINQLISAPVIKVSSIKRDDIPEEKGKAGAGPGPGAKPGSGGGGKGQGKNHGEMVSNHAFTVSYVCKQRQGANVLNALINPNAPQFLIPRTIRILNSNPKPPSRIDATAGAGAPPPDAATAVPGAAPAAGSGTVGYLVGEETVEFTVRLEIVDFAEPEASAAK